mgnify:CR=1 FL=1
MGWLSAASRRHRQVLILSAFVVAFLFPFTQGGSDANMSIATQILIFAATAMGLNIVVGLAGSARSGLYRVPWRWRFHRSGAVRIGIFDRRTFTRRSLSSPLISWTRCCGDPRTHHWVAYIASVRGLPGDRDVRVR